MINDMRMAGISSGTCPLIFYGPYRIVSLEELLSDPADESKPAFTRHKRLALGIILANSLLQRHAGQQMNETWAKNDIFGLSTAEIGSSIPHILFLI